MQGNKRVALVTGCAKQVGIGRSTVLALSAAGFTVVASDIHASGAANQHDIAPTTSGGWRGLDSLVEEVQRSGGIASAVVGDVSIEADANRMVKEAIARHGRLDVLVNNAAAPHGADRNEIEDVPVDAWDRVMAVNARGTFLMCRAAIPGMRKAKWGRIINISSKAVGRGSTKRTAYVASKAAIVGLTKALALDLGASGITVNAIMPGPVLTSRATSTNQREFGGDQAAAIAERAKAVPVGRLGKPEDIAGMIAFLATDAAEFVTGQAIGVDGGWW
jgi:3-oxoacyl-[acyl-carrier protein] reductase